MPNPTDEKFDEMIQLLKEILKWIRFEGVQRAKTTLQELLKTGTERQVYESSDGRSSREVAEMVGVSHGTVVNYWNRWSKHGIVEEERARGGTRYKKIFSLSDFGIEVPEAEIASAETEVKRQESPKANTTGNQQSPKLN